MPQCRNLDRDTFLRQPLTQLDQGQIRLGGNPPPDRVFHVSDARYPISALPQAVPMAFLLEPITNLVDPEATDLEAACNLGWAITPFQGTQYTLAQVL